MDESDPDFALPNAIHAYQTAERIRRVHPDKDWMQLTGLIHDLGKVSKKKVYKSVAFRNRSLEYESICIHDRNLIVILGITRLWLCMENLSGQLLEILSRWAVLQALQWSSKTSHSMKILTSRTQDTSII